MYIEYFKRFPYSQPSDECVGYHSGRAWIYANMYTVLTMKSHPLMPRSTARACKRFRLLAGALNGIVGTSKTMISEICGKEHEVVGMSFVTSEWYNVYEYSRLRCSESPPDQFQFQQHRERTQDIGNFFAINRQNPAIHLGIFLADQFYASFWSSARHCAMPTVPPVINFAAFPRTGSITQKSLVERYPPKCVSLSTILVHLPAVQWYCVREVGFRILFSRRICPGESPRMHAPVESCCTNV